MLFSTSIYQTLIIRLRLFVKSFVQVCSNRHERTEKYQPYQPKCYWNVLRVPFKISNENYIVTRRKWNVIYINNLPLLLFFSHFFSKQNPANDRSISSEEAENYTFHMSISKSVRFRDSIAQYEWQSHHQF